MSLDKAALEDIVRKLKSIDPESREYPEGVSRPAVPLHEGIQIFKIEQNSEEWFLKIAKEGSKKGHAHVLRCQWFYDDSATKDFLDKKLIPEAKYGEVDKTPYIATKKLGVDIEMRKHSLTLEKFTTLLCSLFVPKSNLRESEVAEKISGNSLYDTLKECRAEDLKLYLSETMHRATDYLERLPNSPSRDTLFEMLKTHKKIDEIDSDLQLKLIWVPADLHTRNVTVSKLAETYSTHLIDQFKPSTNWSLYGPPQAIIHFFESNRKYPHFFHPIPLDCIEDLIKTLREAYLPIIESYPANVRKIITDVLGAYTKCWDMYRNSVPKTSRQPPLSEFVET